MPTIYFRVMATDNTPTFEPVQQWMGVWSGVAAVDDEKEIERLRERKATELTKEQYDEETKKKASLRSNFPDFREVASGLNPVQLAVKQAAEIKPQQEQQPAAVKAPLLENATAPVPLPSRRKSSAVV